MNIDRTPHPLNRNALNSLLLTLVLLLTACGGSDDKSSSSSSVSSSLTSSSSSSSVSGNAVWPDLNISAVAPKTLAISWTPVEGATSYQLFKSDGSGGYLEVGAPVTTPSAMATVSVHLQDWLNGSYMVEACVAALCQNSNPVTAQHAIIGAIGYVKASNTDADDWFGWSLALSRDGTTLAVAAPAEDSNATGINSADPGQASNTSRDSGAVYVYALTDGVWLQQAYIKASNTEQPNTDPSLTLPNDRFGYRVSLSDDGNTLAVSALLEDSKGTGINCNQGNSTYYFTDASNLKPRSTDAGAVYVFNRTGTEWNQEAYLKPSRYLLNHRFGITLTLSGDGNTLAVGSTNENSSSVGIQPFSASTDPLSCEEANSIPEQIAVSSSSSSTSSSTSSSSSSSSSSITSNSPGGNGSGAVYIFNRTDGSWTQEAFIKASNANSDDAFGTSLALAQDGNTLAVGAPGDDSVATGINGDQANYTLEENGKVFYPNIDSGSAYIFRRAGQSWTQESYIKPLHASFGLQFGSSIDLSADATTLAVGAVGDFSRATGINGDASDYVIPEPTNILPSSVKGEAASNSGAAYIFTFNGTTWSQNAYIKASNAERGDQFGKRLRLSGDGTRLAVASIVEASLATGINGHQIDNTASIANTGAVYVFALDNTGWSQKSYVKPSNTKGGDRFGADIGLSNDGTTMAVGAYRESSQATGINGDQTDRSRKSAGAVYLY